MITIVRAVQTSSACPSQWDSWDGDGNYYYLRYRSGRGQVRQYRTADWVGNGPDELVAVVADFEHGHPLDGSISLEDFARLAGLRLAEDLSREDYGQHVTDELILGGITELLEKEEAATPEAAQRLHERRRAGDPDHDQAPCWCCCLDCGFDVEEVTGDGEHGGPAAEGV